VQSTTKDRITLSHLIQEIRNYYLNERLLVKTMQHN